MRMLNRFLFIVYIFGLSFLPSSLTEQRVAGGAIGTTNKGSTNKVKLVANWTTFNILSEVDPKDAKEFISSFPIMTFWDNLKGSFRTGAIADSLVTLYPSMPNLVSKVDKRVYHAGQYYQIKHSIVDNNFIYMNMLVSVQALIQQYENMTAIIGEYRRSSEFSSLLQDLQSTLLLELNGATAASSSCSDDDQCLNQSSMALIDANGNYLLDSHEEIDQRRESLDLMEILLNITQQINHLENQVQREIQSFQQKERIRQRNLLHQSIVNKIEEYRVRIAEELKVKEKELEEIIVNAEEQDFQQQKLDLQEEYKMIITSLEEEIKLTMALITYRHEEEMKIIEENESREQYLLTLKHDYLRKSTEEIVSVFCDEIIHFFMYLFQDIWFVLWWGRIVLFSVVVVVSTLEASQSLQLIYHKLYLQKNRLYSQAIRYQSWKMFFSKFIPGLSKWVYVPYKGDHKNGSNTLFGRFLSNIQSQRLIYHSTTMQMLQDAFESCCIAFTHQAPLPNLLLCGSPGCGKTVTTSLFTDSLTEMAYIRLSGADILALGSYSNTFLKETFEGCIKSQIPTLLIIDEADHLISSRDRVASLSSSNPLDQSSVTSSVPPQQQQQLQQQHVGSHCLFALLEGVRESNHYVSLMLTTRLTIDRIDSALLDRMDKLIHFPLPAWRQRLYFILEHIKDQVKDFIPDESEKILVERLTKASAIASTSHNVGGDSESESDQDTEATMLLQNVIQSLSTTELKNHLRDHDIQQRVSRYVKKLLGGRVAEDNHSAGNVRQVQPQLPPSQQVVDPELDHQPAVVAEDSINSVHANHHRIRATEDLYEMMRQEALRYIDEQLSVNSESFSATACNVQLCVKAMVLCSHGWSYRDLQKRLMNLRYSVLCSESCKLTTATWMKELTFEELK